MKIKARFITACTLSLLGATGHQSAGAKGMPLTSASEEAIKIYREAGLAFDDSRGHDAMKLYQKALEFDSNFAMAWLRLAALDHGRRWEYVDRARSRFSEISQGERDAINADAAVWRDNGVLHDSLISAVVQRHPGDYRYCQFMGNVLTARHNHDSALFWYQQAVTVNPAFPRAFNDLGYTQTLLGDTAAARESFRRYIELMPESFNPYFSMGDFEIAIGDLDAAAGSLRAAITRNDVPSILRYALILALVFDGNNKAVDEALGEWRATRPDAVRQQEYAEAMAAAYNGMPDTAHAILRRRAHVLTEDNPLAGYRALVEIAEYLLWEGDVAGAESTLNDAEDILTSAFPNAEDRAGQLVPFLSASCAVKAAGGDNERAEALALEAIKHLDTLKQYTDRELYHEMQGVMAAARGRHQDALYHLQLANTDAPRNIARLAQASVALRDTRTALSEYARAILVLNYDLAYVQVRSHAERRMIELMHN